VVMSTVRSLVGDDGVMASARWTAASMSRPRAYFGSKDGLFDAVLGEHLEMIVNTVPLDGTCSLTCTATTDEDDAIHERRRHALAETARWAAASRGWPAHACKHAGSHCGRRLGITAPGAAISFAARLHFHDRA